METSLRDKRIDELVKLVLRDNPRASRLSHLISLAQMVDPHMQMAEIRAAWSHFNNFHRTPRLGRSPIK